jgi:hypothetical protein
MTMYNYDTNSPHSIDLEQGDDTTDMGGEASTDMGGEVVEDSEAQIEGAIGALQEVEGLQPEVWEQLDATERLNVLQDTENRMAEIQGRPPVAINAEPMESGVYGGYIRGEGITISEEHLMSDDTHEITDTIVHEGRHAYQDYAIQNPGFLSDTELVESWRDNWDNYLTAEAYGQELYASQPIEADAWEYGARIADAVFGIQR